MTIEYKQLLRDSIVALANIRGRLWEAWTIAIKQHDINSKNGFAFLALKDVAKECEKQEEIVKGLIRRIRELLKEAKDA